LFSGVRVALARQFFFGAPIFFSDFDEEPRAFFWGDFD